MNKKIPSLLGINLLTLASIAVAPLPCNAEELPNTTEAQSQQQIDKRHIPLTGQSNFRDIGGYKTTDGKTLAWGKVYRSGILHKLTDDDVQKLEDLGIKTVVNFLTENEIKYQGEDKLPQGVKKVFIPISAEDALGPITDDLIIARQTGDFSKIPAEINSDIHRAAITSANKEYKQLMLLLADSNNYPIAFHCSHGVHRTGTATALILSALDVPWETVRKDYLLSNKYRGAENKKRIQQLSEKFAETKGVQLSEVDRSDIKAFYILQPIYIDASLDQATRDYGSMQNYIQQGLGVDSATLTKIKYNLLTK